MKLYELLILSMWVPLWWFGSMWFMRVLVIATAAKIGAAAAKKLKEVKSSDGEM